MTRAGRGYPIQHSPARDGSPVFKIEHRRWRTGRYDPRIMDSPSSALAVIGLSPLPDDPGNVRWVQWVETGRAHDRQVRERCRRFLTLTAVVALLVAAALVGLQ